MYSDVFPMLFVLILVSVFLFLPIFVLIRLWNLTQDVTALKNWQNVQKPDMAALHREFDELKQKILSGGIGEMKLETAGIGEHATVSARQTEATPRAPQLAYDLTLAQSIPLPQTFPSPARQRPSVGSVPPERTSPPTAAPLPPTAKPPVPAAKTDKELESILGANWLAKLGVAAIAVAVAFFLQYAFRSGLIGPAAQVAIGLCGSALMLGGGQYLLKKPPYRTYAQVLASGGVIVFFLSIYAAYAFYEPRLISYLPAFAAFAIGALVVSVWALVNNTESVAILCVLGAFAAPVLIREGGTGATDPDSLLRLYAYLVFLNLWVVGLLRFRAWHSLTVVSFASTWLIFYNAGSLRNAGWATEGFAALFLLFACYMGVRGLYAPQALSTDETQTGETPLELSESAKVGLGLIVGGCAAFAFASALILNTVGIIGFPDASFAGILVALILAGMAMMLPTLSHSDKEIRLFLGYASTLALVLVLGASMGTSPPPTREQVPMAFGFTVFNFVLFLIMSLVIHRRQEQENAAAFLCAGNALIHIAMVHHVLQATNVLIIPAVSLWMPIAACLLLGAVRIAAQQHKEAFVLRATLIIAAQILPLYGLCALQEQLYTEMGALLFAGEFVLISAVGLALRRHTMVPLFRADLLMAFGNAAVFFGMIARVTGRETYEHSHFVMLAGWAIAMAVYHAFVGGSLLRKSGEDTLHRLTYLGLAVTFLSIAIPLQLEASYITLAWATEAAVLVWTGIAARERRAGYYGMALLALAATKALCIDLLTPVVDFHFLLNSRMLAGAAIIASAYLMAWFFYQNRENLSAEERPFPAGLVVLANAFTLLFVSVDLWEYMGQLFPADGQISAQHLALSIFWTMYALVGVSVGIWKRVRPVRLFAMGLLYLSIVKVFLFDLARLEPLYRIFSFFTLGVILLLVSYLYTRFEGWICSEGENDTTPNEVIGVRD